MKLRHIFVVMLALAGATAFATPTNGIEVLWSQGGVVVVETPGGQGTWIEAQVNYQGQTVMADACDASSGTAAP